MTAATYILEEQAVNGALQEAEIVWNANEDPVLYAACFAHAFVERARSSHLLYALEKRPAVTLRPLRHIQFTG